MKKLATLSSLFFTVSLLAQSINFNFATTNPPATLTNIVASLGTGGVGIAAAAGTNISLLTNASLVTFSGVTDTNVVNALAAAQAALATNTARLAVNLATTFLGLHGNADTATTATSANNSTNFFGQLSPTNFNNGLNAGVSTWLRGDGTWISPGGNSGAPFASVDIAGTGITIVTNSAAGTNSYTHSVSDPLTLTTLNAGTANLTNVIGNGIGLTNLNWGLTNNSHYTGNNQFSGSNNYTGTLVVEGAMRVDDGSLIATNMTARTNGAGSQALTTYGGVLVNGAVTATGITNLGVTSQTLLGADANGKIIAGSVPDPLTLTTVNATTGNFTNASFPTGATFGGPATTTSSTSNAPSATEFATAGWIRGLFNSGFIEYATSNIDNTATNPATLNQVVYQFWNGVIPQPSVRTWASGFITNNGYIGAVITTNTFTSLSGPISVNAYLGATTAGSLNNYFLTIHPELYYSYDKTNWYGDYVANSQAITGNATNLYSWVISFPEIISTNATGFYIQRRLKIDTASTAGNVPTVYFMVGTNLVSGNSSASHISISGQSAGLGTSPARSLGITIDGGGSAITLGTKGYLEVPCNCSILSGTILADQSGSIAIETWRTNSASMPPTRAGVLFTNYLTTAQASTDSTLANATSLTLAAQDRIAFNVITNALSVTRATLQLRIQP